MSGASSCSAATCRCCVQSSLRVCRYPYRPCTGVYRRYMHGVSHSPRLPLCRVCLESCALLIQDCSRHARSRNSGLAMRLAVTCPGAA